MNKSLLSTLLMVAASSVLAADSTPKDEVIAAAKKLADQANYSWRTTVVVPEDAPFKPGPTEGKTEKDGFTHISMTFGDNTTQVALKAEKAAVQGMEGGWQSASEMEEAEGPGRFMAMFARNSRTPAAHAIELVKDAKDLKKDGDVYSSALTEDGAKTLMTFRRRAGGGGPEVSGAKGSVKFWLKDGMLAKFEFKVQGKMSFNNNDMDIDRTTTVEIKDVGATKLTLPDDAKKKVAEDKGAKKENS